jgi:hypothetical protein
MQGKSCVGADPSRKRRKRLAVVRTLHQPVGIRANVDGTGVCSVEEDTSHGDRNGRPRCASVGASIAIPSRADDQRIGAKRIQSERFIVERTDAIVDPGPRCAEIGGLEEAVLKGARVEYAGVHWITGKDEHRVGGKWAVD